MKKIRDVKPPRGFSRFLFKLPNVIYDTGLGSLMGTRFVQLEHIGRKSGKLYKTVVEVVKYDRGIRKIYVASGFKEKSDWLKNIELSPQVEINLRGKVYPAVAVRLEDEQAAEVLLDYAHEHPLAMRELAKFMGYQIDGSDQDVRQLAVELPIVEISFLLEGKKI